MNTSAACAVDTVLFKSLDLGEHGLARILGPLEGAVMDVIWKEAEAVTAREVLERLTARQARKRRPPSGPAMTTVITTLERLQRKGLLLRQGTRGEYVYRPAVTREALARTLVQRVIDRLLRDFTGSALSYLIRHGDLKEGEADALRREVERRRRREESQ